jgi:carboxyl-terminal processing protease
MKIQLKHRLSALLIAFSSGALVSLLITLVSTEHPRETPNTAKPTFGLDDKDILLYLEAITQIKQKASSLSPDVTRAQIVEQTLRAYLAQKDPCCDYLTREEYRRFKESLDESYVGIGMEIRQDRDGRIICLPQPESPAARAGIIAGDQLKKIDGLPVDGKSLFAVAAMARGKPGTEVKFIIATKSGTEKPVRVTRSNVTLQSVSKRSVGGRPIIGVSHFTRDTSGKMRQALKSWQLDIPIIIDLRGNGGGDLHAAIDSAMLFLKEGKKIVSVETRNGTMDYESKAAAVDLTTPVYLWQDEGTASAAEVFIAALTDNDRAVSIGKWTAGKGTKEEIIELSDGSALILATGVLQTPRGSRYQGRGLKPTYELKNDPVDTMHYLIKVGELTGAKRTGYAPRENLFFAASSKSQSGLDRLRERSQ